MCNDRIAIVVVAVALLVGCSERIDDVSSAPSLAPAVGQCIEVTVPVEIKAEDTDSNLDYLIPLRAGLAVKSDGFRYFPSGTQFAVRRFIIEKTIENEYFFIYGTVNERRDSAREVNLQPLINFDWISDSAQRIKNNKMPALPPARKVPLRPDVARNCE